MKLIDIECPECGHIFEDLVLSTEDLPVCTRCQCHDTHQKFGCRITKLHDPDVRNAELKRRSAEHSKKTMPDNIERLKAAGKI